MPKIQEFELCDESPLKALIVYDEPGSVLKAQLVLQRSAWNAGFDVPRSINCWQIDLLKCSPTAEKALTDAIDAHLVLVTSHAAKLASCWFHEWLEHWGKCRQIEGAVLALLRVAQSDILPQSMMRNVCRIARNHGFGLIVDDSRGGSDQVRLIELSLGGREQAHSDPATVALDSRNCIPRISWGINE